MIFYFSSTGNCKYIAEKIAEHENDRLISISSAVLKGEYTFTVGESETVGFVTPTYFYGLPVIVNEFLSKMELIGCRDNYIYHVLTFGTSTGSANEALETRLRKKGITLSAKYAIRMVDNYVPTLKIPGVIEIKQILDQADEKLVEVCKSMHSRRIGDMNSDKGFAPPLLSIFAYSVYKFGRQTNKFYVTDKCVGCGICKKVCPYLAIDMVNKVPSWTKERCVLCLGCLHRCPKSAIQYGKKTEYNGRYINPNTRL